LEGGRGNVGVTKKDQDKKKRKQGRERTGEKITRESPAEHNRNMSFHLLTKVTSLGGTTLNTMHTNLMALLAEKPTVTSVPPQLFRRGLRSGWLELGPKV